ncbi:MAG: AMP-binding protein [bacterium]
MVSLIRHILDITKQYGEKPAFIYYKKGEEKILSYNGFRRLIYAFSQTIQEKDISPHSLVLLVGENSPKWPAAYLGAHLCGHTVIHGDIRFTEIEFRNILNFTGPSLILCDKKFEGYFKDYEKKILLDDISPLSSDNEINISYLDNVQPMSIILTSGTTGNPKGVMLSESNFMSNLRMFESMKDLVSSKDKIVAILPLHHVYPFTCTVLAPVYFGATLIYPASLKGEDIFGAIKKHEGTILIAIPRVLELFCSNVFDKVSLLPKGKKFLFKGLYFFSRLSTCSGIRSGKILFHSIHRNFPSFRYFACGGAPLDVMVHKRLNTLGFKIIEAYGLSETSPIAAMNSLKRPVPGSVGQPAPGVEIKLEKKDPVLQHGEICIKGPNVMMGYYKRPDLTEKVVINGWFHSGDLGYSDPKGNIFITGRKDEVIVLSNGKNIYPEELEKHYGQSRKIKEICIILLKEGTKESLTAVVYPDKEFFIQHKNANIFLDIKFDIETAAQKLPSYQRISRIEIFNEEFPKTALGKIKRYKILKTIYEKALSPEEQEESIPLEEQDHFLAFVTDFLKLKKFPKLKDNLETDLGLDSLSKLEILSALEKRYDVKISDEEASGAFTLEDIKRLVSERSQVEMTAHEESLEDKILISPDPPLEKHVSTGRNPLAILARFFFHLLFKIIIKIFFKAELEGRENLKDLHPPFIIAPNHVSYLDALIIYGMFPFKIINNCFFISIPQYFAIFPLSIIRKIGRIILTGTWDTSVISLQYSYQALKSGKIMCVFPEGGRSIDGNIEEPKKGIGYVAKQSGAPLLPVYIDGSGALLSRKNPGLHKAHIRVSIVPPIYPEGAVEDFLSEWREKLQNSHDQKDN